MFDAVVPALILLAVALMAIRPSPKQHEDGNNMVAGVASSFSSASTAATSALRRGSS